MLLRIVRLLVPLLLAGLPCLSQSDLRGVAGTVTDKRGNALPGAAVQLENTDTLTIVSYITGKDGRFHFERLSEDVDYTLKAKYRRYWSDHKTLSKFDSSKHREIKLVVPID